MDTVTKRISLAAAILLLALLWPNAALAQGNPKATVLRVGVPEGLRLGERAAVQALLTDTQGGPISKAQILFTLHSSFLTGEADVLVAQAVTNDAGQAVADFQNNLAGSLTLRAQFRGDDHFAPSGASAPLSVTGDAQLYVPQAGVQIPGFNQPPPAPISESLNRPLLDITPDMRNLWPSMSGWPIAVALIVVWSLYVFAVALIFRVAASAPPSRRGYNVETRRFE